MSGDPMNFDDREFPPKTAENFGAGLEEVKDRVSDLTAKVRDKAGQVADTLSGSLDQQRNSAADGLARAASTMHQKAGSAPGGPKVVNLTHSLADGMETTASFLRDHDFSQMGKEMMSVCRRYPTQSIVAALAVGFLVGRSRR